MNEEIPANIPLDDMSATSAKQPALVVARRSRWRWVWWLVVAVLVVVWSGYAYTRSLNTPPADFPVGEPITIGSGAGVRSITEQLAAQHVVRSASFLYYLLVLTYDPTNIKASTYVFDAPMTTREIAQRLTEGDFDTDLVRLTHIEGETVAHLATRAAAVLPTFEKARFVQLAASYEGRLFPETYLIPATFTEQELLDLMLSTFETKTKELPFDSASSTLSLDEVLILASIIEREANSPESMKMVSGILQNRLEIGMPLQADASIEYVLDKPLAELVPEDLEIDSPYNTYLNVGLPPTPIGNPGLDAIMAVLEPSPSDFFYYITGHDGEFHYAKTYAEHQRNIERYLRLE